MFNLSSILQYNNSFGMVLKQTMIEQENVFSNQVYELHRLFRIQKTLTGEFGCKELDTYNSLKQRLLSPTGTFTNLMHYASLGEGKFYRNFGAGSTETLNQDQFFYCNISPDNEMDLTLRIGEDTRKKVMAKEACYEKNSCFFPNRYLELEASTDTVSPEDTKNASGLSYATPVTGCREPNSGSLSNATSLTEKLFASNELIKFDFDLNKVESDNFFDLNDPVDTCLSTPGPSSPFDKLKGINSDEASCSYATSFVELNGACLIEPSITPPRMRFSKENITDICDVEITDMLEENVSLLQPCKFKTRLEDAKINAIHPMSNEPVEGNDRVQKAAELLLHFSLESSLCNEGNQINVGPNVIENKGSDCPQCSVDSYESIVLKLEEASVDDYCVSSKAFEINEFVKKESGVMWRRGRRLKDFQKDILPNIVSLSRHEIREDVAVMEAAMRSREYKRMRTKAPNGDRFTPTKCKRSRPCGRRYS